jgi:2-methylisocitrate lyase-like PEP mutase family enzyme
MSDSDQAILAGTLRDLHRSARPLVLPNVWDAASARIIEDAGYPAIATSSAGMAYSLGYADGQQVPPAEMFAAVARIVRAVRVPVTADIESGYGDAAAATRELIKTGAVGMNLEDMADGVLIPLERQVETIGSVIDEARRAGIPMVLNARTDIYLAHVGDAGSRFDRTVERLLAFAKAGADCVFVPGVYDEETISKLVRCLELPLNILATEGSPPISRLRELGVARVSAGSGPMRATMALARHIATEMRDLGTYETFTTRTIPYPEANTLFRR